MWYGQVSLHMESGNRNMYWPIPWAYWTSSQCRLFQRSNCFRIQRQNHQGLYVKCSFELAQMKHSGLAEACNYQ